MMECSHFPYHITTLLCQDKMLHGKANISTRAKSCAQILIHGFVVGEVDGRGQRLSSLVSKSPALVSTCLQGEGRGTQGIRERKRKTTVYIRYICIIVHFLSLNRRWHCEFWAVELSYYYSFLILFLLLVFPYPFKSRHPVFFLQYKKR